MIEVPRCVMLTGANSGIGFATCKLLADNGFYVFAGVKDQQGLDYLKEQKIENVEPVLLNLTNKQHLKVVVDKIEGYCKPPVKFHAIINNAGFAAGGPLELTGTDLIHQSFEINVFSPLELIKRLLPILRRDKGRIVNISSTNAIISFPYMGIYSATKFALEAISDALRLEIKKWGIPVSVIYPDVVKTPIFDKSIPLSYSSFETHTAQEKQLYRNEFDRFVNTIRKMVKKGVEPEVIAASILKCINAPKPKISYIPEKNGVVSFALKKLLSKKMLDKLLLKQLN
ncbi:MAG: SDR family NAD(P)-dependent oxidoreductase [Bacteroidales bacterium]|nr:SDR family NAD(P)-dependent oxidoreductase [Bacteroidales bacterium]